MDFFNWLLVWVWHIEHKTLHPLDFLWNTLSGGGFTWNPHWHTKQRTHGFQVERWSYHQVDPSPHLCTRGWFSSTMTKRGFCEVVCVFFLEVFVRCVNVRYCHWVLFLFFQVKSIDAGFVGGFVDVCTMHWHSGHLRSQSFLVWFRF